MPIWLEKILGSVYTYVPKSIRPFVKKAFLWTILRIEAVARMRRILRGEQVVFMDNEIADTEQYEFLSPGTKEVTIRSSASTVSPGTENAVLCGLPGARKSFPYYPGYSCAGVVERVGKGVTHFEVGQRVVGRVGHASRATVSADRLFSIPDGVDFESASFLELGIIVLQGVRKARIKPGDRVVVLGQGLIGQLCNRFATMMGAAEVIAVATSRRRESTALQDDGADRFVTLEGGEEVSCVNADVVLEAVGLPRAIATAMLCARVGGRVSLIGSARGLSWDFSIYELIQARQVEVIGAHISAMPGDDISAHRWTYQAEGELFLKLLQDGALSVQELITWRARPKEANAVYECLVNGGGQQVGIVFGWNQ